MPMQSVSRWNGFCPSSICASTFFIEGGFANFVPYTVERFGVRLERSLHRRLP
jgi:hypothetical protein